MRSDVLRSASDFFGWRLTLALLLFPLIGNAATPQIWFAPLDTVHRGSLSGSPQYMSLFTPPAPWTTAASHVNVFKIYPQWINNAADSDLQIQFADLNRRGIALALEYGPITAQGSCGQGMEGAGGETLVAAAQRIQRNGGVLRYLAMDEPIYYFTLNTGQNSCQWTVDAMAANAAVNVHALLAQFPNVMVGDIEPVPIYSSNWLQQYQAGVEAFRRAFGFPLAFFDADVLWRSPSYLTALSSTRSMLVLEGVPFGIIYNGDSDTSDAEWIQAASYDMASIELNLGSPDVVIFQNWTHYPQKLLPETDSDSFTYLIDSYFRRRTFLTASLANNLLQGTLIAADNAQPIAGATANLSLSLTSGSGVPSVYTVSGTVPAGTQSMVVGARVNAECACAANANLLISAFTVSAGAPGVITRDFSNPAIWSSSLGGSPPPTEQIQGSSLQIVAQPGQSVILNSSPIPVALSPVPFTLTVSAQVAPVSSGSGYFVAVFLDSSSAEISRATIPFAPATVSATTFTDSQGRFFMALPYTGPTAFQVMANYAGSTDYWPAQSSAIQVQSAALGISETHTGNFSRGQNGASYTVNVSNRAGSANTSGIVTVDETIPAGLTPVSMSGTGWNCPGATQCTRTDALPGGASYPPITVTVNVAANAPSSVTSQAMVSGGGTTPATAMDATVVSGSGTSFTITGQVTLSQAAMPGVTLLLSGTQSGSTTTDAYGNFILSGLAKGGTYIITPTRANYIFNPLSATVSNLNADQVISFTASTTNGLGFYPVTPCRIADTRTGAGFSGQFGPPSMAGGATRVFNIPSGSCGIPATAAAYSLNFTVAPPAGGPQGNLTTWPAGQAAMPNVSTLNFSGSVVANAAIVPAGSNGGINVFVNYPTDVLIDINGYFATAQIFSTGLEFYPLPPCRVADTRSGAGFSGQFGPPSLTGVTRSFNLAASSCGIPVTAAAYSLNFTVAPPASGPQSNLTTWPAGQATIPNVSTLNYAGSVVANAAIVPAGTNSGISVFANHPTDVLFDVNGYFALPASSSLHFYAVTPCRIADTRAGAGFSGQFGPPTMPGGTTRSFTIPASSCGVPATAVAYSLNFTVAPPAGGPQANLTIWPSGQANMPNVSTLNYSGSVVANAAIVPAGTNGAISVYVNHSTDVLFDINGYFAP